MLKPVGPWHITFADKFADRVPFTMLYHDGTKMGSSERQPGFLTFTSCRHTIVRLIDIRECIVHVVLSSHEAT